MLPAAEAPKPNAIFDESGNFLLYSTLLGIKVGAGWVLRQLRPPLLFRVLLARSRGARSGPLAAQAGVQGGRGRRHPAKVFLLHGPAAPLPACRRRPARRGVTTAFCSTLDQSFLLILMLGQVVNLVTNRVVRIIGKVENTERFLSIALFQVCAPACLPRFPPSLSSPAFLPRLPPPLASLAVLPRFPPGRCRSRASACGAAMTA
jgi:hypothetical protein